MFEDDETNRMADALKVFHMVSNSRHFENIPIILLFNKVDLFREKLGRGIEFESFSEDYEFKGDGSNYAAVTGFVRETFESQNETFNQDRICTKFVSAIEAKFDFSDSFKTIVDFYENH